MANSKEKTWTEYDMEVLIYGATQGCTGREMAVVLKRTRKAVLAKAWREGIVLGRGKKRGNER